MSAVNEELNMKVYEKLFDGQEKFKEWLLMQPPEEILNHAYEYTVRQDIVLAMEYHDLSDDQCRALLSSPALWVWFTERIYSSISARIPSLWLPSKRMV